MIAWKLQRSIDVTRRSFIMVTSCVTVNSRVKYCSVQSAFMVKSTISSDTDLLSDIFITTEKLNTYAKENNEIPALRPCTTV
jgi:hypothetical protein